MIDCHCHLNSKDFDKDRQEVIERAEEITIIDSGTDYKSNLKSLEISKKHKKVYSCLGMDPCLDNYKEISQLIRKHKKHIVGIGEVGLDYKKCKQKPKKDFKRFIKLANKLGKPLVIHSRWAVKPCIEILEQEGAENVLMHAFSGNKKEAKRIIENGWLISIPTSIKWAEQKQRIVEKTPIKNLVTETDSPVMWQERNEPKNVKIVVRKIAEIKHISTRKADKIMTKNAKELFKID